MLFSSPEVLPFGNLFSYSACADVNHDGTLLAVRDYSWSTTVTIYGARDTAPVIVDVEPSAFVICFVYRRGIETLLVHQRGSGCLDEFSLDGAFLRRIGKHLLYFSWGIAYCENTDVLAVSQTCRANHVQLFSYATGQTLFTIGEEELQCPMGVAFTDDGSAIFVADKATHRVSVFRVSDGMLLQHLQIGLYRPMFVVVYEGGICVVTDTKFSESRHSVHLVDSSGAVSHIFLGKRDHRISFSHCKSVHGLIARHGQDILFFSDAWHHSARCAWICACME